MDGVTTEIALAANELLDSSELIRRLCDRGMTGVLARQTIKRLSDKNSIWRSKSLRLPGNRRLFARKSFVGSEAFVGRLLPLLESFRPSLARACKALQENEIILKPHAELLLGTPAETSNSNFPSYLSEVAALQELNICKLEAPNSILERLVIPRLHDNPESQALALKAHSGLTTEIALTNILLEHFRQQNLVSWNTPSFSTPIDSLAVFNNFHFHAATFSWLKPLVRFDDKKRIPSPVLLSVHARQCREYDVSGFLERISRATFNRKSRFPTLGIIAALDFPDSVWGSAKSGGLVCINLRQLFGEAAFEALAKVQELIASVSGNPDFPVDRNYEVLAKMLNDLKVNPFVAALRSFSFEVASAFIARCDQWEDVQLNIKVPFPINQGQTEEREIDVVGKRHSGEEILLVECKALSNSKEVTGEQVRRFFTQTVPAYIRLHAMAPPARCHAEIWTTGKTGHDATTALAALKLNKIILPKLSDKAGVLAKLRGNTLACKRLIETIAVPELDSVGRA